MAATTILLQAWRERWTPLQWLVEIKKNVKESDTESVKALADCLVQQATFGSTPGKLILSYLKHSVTTKLVPYSAALSAVHQFQNVNKHACLSALLDLLLAITPNIRKFSKEFPNIQQRRHEPLLLPHVAGQFIEYVQNFPTFFHYPHQNCPEKEEACVELSLSLLKIVYWLLITVMRLLKLAIEVCRLPAGSQLNAYLANITKCREVFSLVIGNASFRSLVIVGKMEDKAVAVELDRQFQVELKRLINVRQASGDSVVELVQRHYSQIMVDISRLHSLNPLNGSAERNPGQVPNAAIHMMTQIQAVVYPEDTPEDVAELLTTLQKSQNLSRQQLYIEVIRSSLNGVLEASETIKEALWCGFLFIKLPRAIGILENRYPISGTPEHVMAIRAFEHLLQFTPLLDDVDLKCSCVSYEIMLNQYIKCVNQSAGELNVKSSLLQLISRRKAYSQVNSVETVIAHVQLKTCMRWILIHLNSEFHAMLSWRQYPAEIQAPMATTGQVTLIINAESQMFEIINVLEIEPLSCDDQLARRLSTLLDPTRFVWTTVAAASLGKISSLITGLIRVTEASKHPAVEREDVRSSELRRDLFQMAFVLLIRLCQMYGKQTVVRNQEENSYIVRWIYSHLPENPSRRCYYPETQYRADAATVNYLLDQFFGGTISSGLEDEVLLVYNSIGQSQVRWDDLCWNTPSSIHEVMKGWQFSAPDITVDVIQRICDNIKNNAPSLAICACAWACGHLHTLTVEDRRKTKELLQFLCSKSNLHGRPESSIDRYSLLSEVVNNMASFIFVDKEEHKEPLPKEMSQLFQKTMKEKSLNKKNLQDFRRMLNVGGTTWFCNAVVKEVLKLDRQEELGLAVDLGTCLLLLDYESLVHRLLSQVLPNYLHHNEANTVLKGPKGWALARLAAHSASLGMVKELAKESADETQNSSRPSKIRKLDGATETSTNIQRALVSLCEEFAAVVRVSEVGPLASMLVSFLNQAVACTSSVTGPVLTCLPTHLVKELFDLAPSVVDSPDVILGACNLKTTEGRRLCARALCQGINGSS